MAIVGTENSEPLFGTSGDDLIQGFGGNDDLFGLEGDDTLEGGDGDDFLHGDLGNDWLDGGAGFFDWAFFDGAPGGVQVNLGNGQVTGAMGNDTLVGVENIAGTNHADVLIGDAGNNMLQGRGGDDLLDGGGGYDSIDYFHASGSVTVNLQAGTASGADGADTLLNFEAVNGSSYGDILIGNAGNNGLQGGGGDDILNGGGGDDFLHGDTGNDFIRGGADGTFGDTVSYQTSTSGVNVDLAAGTASDGLGGTDTLLEIEHVNGTQYADVLRGDGATNWFRPDAGDDFVDGAGGGDVVMYEGAAAGVIIDLEAGTATGASIGTDTLVSIEAAHGTSFADDVTLTNGGGYVFGRGGDDVLRGGAGFDNLIGGTGNDTLIGGASNDSVSYFDDGFDGAGGVGVTVDLTLGKATDNWGFTDDLSSIENVSGSQHDDQLYGSSASDFLDGQAGDDLIQGFGDSDNLSGREGNDTLDGGDGDDFLHGDLGDDRLDGGAGLFDWAFFDGATGGINVHLGTGQVSGAMGNDTIVGVENVGGTDHDDTLVGDAGNNMLQGRGGNDVLDGGGGYDSVDYFHALGSVTVDLQAGLASGADGADTLLGFEAANGSSYGDLLVGNGGHNGLHGGDGDDILHGLDGDDHLVGGLGSDFVTGGDGNDNLNGQDGDDRLDGGDGGDYLQGGAGDDTIDGGASGDNISYADSTSGVIVDLQAGIAVDGMGGNDVLSNIEHVQGSQFADSLTGDGNTNLINPEAGDDFVDGRGGNDVVMYESATAGVTINLQLALGTATGASIGSDILVSIEAAHGTRFADDITLTNGGGYVFGRSGDDVLRGGAGFDNLIGGTGNDTLIGGGSRDNASYFDDGYDGPGGHGVTVDLAAGTAIDNWGFTDTLSSIENVSGSQYDDQLFGSSAANEFFSGEGGDDLIAGRGGNDAFGTGYGNDTMDGGAITDLINYSDLNSINYGSASTGIVMNLDTGVVQDGLGGVDQLANINFVVGSSHDDSITGSSGIYFEQLDGGEGDDTIDGGAINASFSNSNRVTYFSSQDAVTVNLALGTASSSLGNDTLININHVFGSTHHDVIVGSDSTITESFAGRAGDDVIDGAGGFDEVRYNFAGGPVNVNFATGIATGGEGGTDTLSNIEGVRGSNGSDILVGGNVANDAFEFFMGMAGNDFIDGGTGYDRADYGSSGAGVNVTLGGAFNGSAQDGFGTTDTLVRIEAVRGSTFNDTLTGSDIATLESFEGREGNDLIDGRGGVDRADYAGVASAVTVNLATGTAADGYGGTDTLIAIENVRGSSFNDLVTGNAVANFLLGNAGNDTMIGGAGDDTLAGGAGNDSLVGGEGNDEFKYEAKGSGLDTISGFAMGDTLLVEATMAGQAASGNGSTLLAGQMQALQANNGTTLYIGTDAIAGADIQIRFDTLITPSQFTVLGTGGGYSLIGLADAPMPSHVAEIAVQFKAVGKANADVASKVEGRSTTNEVAVARVTEALERFLQNAQGADDQGTFIADAPDAAGTQSLGVTGSMPAWDAFS